MSQFDVHRNTGRNSAVIPFVVILQSAAFDDRRRRIVAPLIAIAKTQEHIEFPATGVTPIFTIADTRLILNPLEISSVAIDALGEKVGSLADAGDVIIAALDEVFSRAWG